MSGFYIGVDGKARKVKNIYIGVDGVARKVTKGFIGVNGIAREGFRAGTPIGDHAVGSSVFLNENGSPVEYLIVHKGLPDETMYDVSCDGVWLLRKDIYMNHQWYVNLNNHYEGSYVHAYLNNDFLNVFDTKTISVIKQVKIPHVDGVGVGSPVAYGVNGLDTKIFLISNREVGLNSSVYSSLPDDGVKLDYFESGNNETAMMKRIAYKDGVESPWFLRSPITENTGGCWFINYDGNCSTVPSYIEYGVRPALILPFDVLLDSSTNIFIG